MPIYEYICQKCQHEFQKLDASSTAKVDCPACGSHKLERKFSTFAAHQGTSAPASPCQAMGCPSAGAGGSPCSGGTCPFSG